MKIDNNLWDIKISPTPDNRYIIRRSIEYTFKGKNIKVPSGYKTNGANIPRFFWWFIPPFKPKNLPAVILHDYLCDLEDYKLADDVFEEVLNKINKGFKSNIMIHAVRIYHRIRYGVK